MCIVIPATARECFHRRWFECVCVFVCLSVTTITKKIVDRFAPNFMRRFLGEREDQVRVSLRSVEGCVSNSQKNSGDCLQNSSVGKFKTSGLQNSECGKCWRQKFFCGDLYSLRVLFI